MITLLSLRLPSYDSKHDFAVVQRIFSNIHDKVRAIFGTSISFDYTYYKIDRYIATVDRFIK